MIEVGGKWKVQMPKAHPQLKVEVEVDRVTYEGFGLQLSQGVAESSSYVIQGHKLIALAGCRQDSWAWMRSSCSRQR